MAKKEDNIRVRMAPSPTGALHVGTARTALFNYLFAKHYGGKFVMRIEDTDKERSEKKWEEDILEGLQWLGIEWDEFYRQSERKHIYEQYIQKLLEEGKAFYCWHTKEELQKEREAQMRKKEAPRHFCSYRDRQTSADESAKNSIIRFRNDAEGFLKFNDLVRSEVKFNAPDLGDFSIAKNLSEPLYNFAVVIDDHEMKITHIIRGEDHIPNTPRQILIMDALGLKKPEYAHLPLLLGTDKSKLSKRHGSTSVSEYRQHGYLADAIFNFLVLLGWRPKDDEKEIMPKGEIIKEFEIEDVQKSGAVFDVEKLNWMNSVYIKTLSPDEFLKLCIPYLKSANFLSKEMEQNTEWLKKLIAMEQERIKTLSEITDAVEFVFKLPKYDGKLLIWRKSDKEGAISALKELNGIINSIEEKDWTKEGIESILMPHAEKAGDRGSFLWPLRVAVSGKKASPGPFEIVEVLGKEETLKRINAAIKKL